jgi:DNA mismatch endonuclease (patch repair protein)
MADNLTPEQRRFNMSRIRSTNTRPEMIVRSMVHRMGYRYRLHRRDLPGKPDLVFPVQRKAIFVHGCFWHMHDCRFGLVKPKTNIEYWQNKRLSNVERDKSHIAALKNAGWQVMVVWECQVKSPEVLQATLIKFLKP